MTPKRIAVIPGDGIGVEVCEVGVEVLEAICSKLEIKLKIDNFPYSAEHFLKTGITLPEEEIENFRQNYDAIFLGALGDPQRVPTNVHAKDILLGLRFKLDLFVNFRPAKVYDENLCPLKDKTKNDINFVVFRENTEGIYVSAGASFKKGTQDEIALQESINTRKGVERIIRYAFEYAKNNNLTKVCMSDKGNAMQFEGDLWMRTFKEVAEEYPGIRISHQFVDALVMNLVRAPEEFEVIVTCNLFGDIITDLAAQLQGGMGMAASGNLNPGKVSLFEPVHGSAPDIAGKGIANPLAAVLTVQMMCDFLGFKEASSLAEKSVLEAISTKNVTKDLGGNLTTKEVGKFLVDFVKNN